MKRPYESPKLGLERYNLTGQTTNCSGIRISAMDEVCILDDKNQEVPPGLKALAGLGFFLEGYCMEGLPEHDLDDGICVHTAIDLAFTS